MSMKRVVIVGGVAGGASAAARLRRLREDFEIIMLDKGPYVSFANCGLPYFVGNVIKDRESLELVTPERFLERFNIDVRVNNEVISIEKDKKKVNIKDLKKKFKTVPLKIGDAGIDFDTLAEHADIFISRKCSLDKLEFSIKHEMGHLVCSSADMLIAYIIKEYGLNKECEAQWAVELEKIINKWINIIDRAIE